MKSSKCIIEKKSFGSFSFFRNTQNGQEYNYLAGGFCWPGLTPGFAVVLGVERTDNVKAKPVLKCLQEVESESPMELIIACLKLQDKYKSEDRFYWYGDLKNPLEKSTHIINDKRRYEKKSCFYITPAWSSEEPGIFASYVYEIQDCLKDKTLFLDDCIRLKNHLQNFPKDSYLKSKFEDFPAVSALGFAVVTLLTYRPWSGLAEGGDYYKELQAKSRVYGDFGV